MKPKKLERTHKYPDGSTKRHTVAEVFSDYWGEDFAEEGDPLSCRFDVKLFGDHLFDGYGPKDQINLSRRLSKFLSQYAEWLEDKANKQEKLNIRIQD